MAKQKKTKSMEKIKFISDLINPSDDELAELLNKQLEKFTTTIDPVSGIIRTVERTEEKSVEDINNNK